MNFDYPCRSLNTSSPLGHPYASSISSSASSSTSSVFSVDGASSQVSVSSLSTNISWDADELPSTSALSTSQAQAQAPNGQPCSQNLLVIEPLARASTFPLCRQLTCRDSAAQRALPPLKTADLPVPSAQRQHPRRSSTLGSRVPPALVRQSERKVNFVDSLVDSATQMVELIWPLSVPTCPSEQATGRTVLPLRTFIQETLRRSRTSFSTLQVALYYLVLIKSHVPKHDFTMEQPEDRQSLRALQCGRRMFLAALILASKYLQDRNYSARAWSKISGLKVCEINTNEMAFLQAVKWRLHIVDSIWERWQAVVLKYTPVSHPPSSPGVSPTNVESSWRSIIPLLTPELEVAEPITSVPHTPVRPAIPSSEGRPMARSPLAAAAFTGGSSCSQESTPTPTHYKLPRFLEPKPDMLPPTPTLARMAPLPTPALTPQTSACITPAAAACMLNFGSRRPSMCSAMAQAQNASMARSAVDQWNPMCKPTSLEAYSMSARRPSIAASVASVASVASSSSSPESMVSDNSSRSSRASSISSVSSSSWAPTQTKLAKLATCRSAARLQFSGLQAMKESHDYIISEPMSSPDLESFHLDDSEDLLSVNVPCSFTEQPYLDQFKPTLCAKSTPKGRKRCRSSVDMSLQQNVRQLLSEARSTSALSQITVLPDRSVAQSFTLENSGDRTPSSSTGPKALQSPKHTVPERRLPVQKDLGRKRTCCASQAAQRIFKGPGMWNNII